MIRRPPRSTRTDTLFPYTTLFRSNPRRSAQQAGDGAAAVRFAKSPFVLSLSKHRSSFARWRERAALRQAQGERWKWDGPRLALCAILLIAALVGVGDYVTRPPLLPSYKAVKAAWHPSEAWLYDRNGVLIRSEERRVGKEWVGTCRSRW